MGQDDVRQQQPAAASGKMNNPEMLTGTSSEAFCAADQSAHPDIVKSR